MKTTIHFVLLLLAGLLSPATSTHAAERITYYHFDAAGSPVSATDEAGNVLWDERYQPYGERIQKDPPSEANTRWYTGHPEDPETGLLYAGARYYDPMVGRFYAVDPAPFTEKSQHSFNRYKYGNNNPYRYVDPDGMAEFSIADIFPTSSNGSPAPIVTMGRAAGGLVAYGQGLATGNQALVNAAAEGLAAQGPDLVNTGITLGTMGRGRPSSLTAAQNKNVERFIDKLPANAKDSVSLRELPNGGVAAQGTSPGRVPGSSAVYEKQIDSSGQTVQYTKTTYDPAGNIVHVKDKLTGGVFK